jgi:hypothetical protein
VGIENSLPKKQKAQGAEPAEGLISIQEVTALCDRHHHNHVAEAPARIGVLAGAEIRATEAERTSQTHYPAFGSRDQGRSRNDVSQLPDRM